MSKWLFLAVCFFRCGNFQLNGICIIIIDYVKYTVHMSELSSDYKVRVVFVHAWHIFVKSGYYKYTDNSLFHWS